MTPPAARADSSSTALRSPRRSPASLTSAYSAITALQESTVVINDTPTKITQRGYDSCSTKLPPPGTVCVSSRALVLRISQLRSARCLADLLLIPPLRAHELGADRKGQISLHLRQPYRLILVPAHIPPPTKPDGGLDWQNVTEVTITEVVDYH